MSGLYEVQRERGTFIRVLGGSRILWTLWQSQPGLCFSGLDVAVPADLPGHRAVQVLQPRAHRMWCCGNLRPNTGLKRSVGWRAMSTGPCSSSRRKANLTALNENQTEHLASLSLSAMLPWAGRNPDSQSLVFVHWNIRLFLAFLWWPAQVTERWYSILHHGLPPKRLLAEVSTGCCFPVQLAQGASHLDLCKMMKEKSVVVRDMSERRGCNHLPCIV